MRLVFFILYILIVVYSNKVQAQDSDYKERIHQILPIENKADFDASVSTFEDLIVNLNTQNFYWDKSFLKMFTQSKKWASVNASPEEVMQADFMILMYYDNQLINDSVIKISEKLISEPNFEKQKKSVYTYNALYYAYERKGFYRRQLSIIDKLLFLNKKFGYPVRPKSYENSFDLAKIYYNLEQYALARLNYKKQEKVFKGSKDYFLQASMLNNIALTFEKENNKDSAYYYYYLALDKLNNTTIVDTFFTKEYVTHFNNVIASNVASLKVSEKIYDGAENIFKSELESSKLTKRPKITLNAYYNLANLYFLQDKHDLAKIYIDSTFYFNTTYPSLDVFIKAKFLKSKLLIKNNDQDQAIRLLDDVFKNKDSLMRVKAEKVYAEATANYNFIEAQKKLRRNEKTLAQKIKTNKILFILVGISIIGSIIIFLLFKKSKDSNRLINIQKGELSKGILEKQKLLDEMHHRTKNNLQIVGGILELQSQKKVNPESHKLLKESQQYLESIAILHKMLYEENTFEDIDFKTYTKNLCVLLISNYPKKNIEYRLDIAHRTFPVGLLTSLGLILCELLTNSLKHAFNEQGFIEISHYAFNNTHKIIYSDDGNNFDKEKFLSSKGTGIKLIKSLVEDLEGDFKITNKIGFHFELNFKT
jgi:two-component sensor histidine kinase